MKKILLSSLIAVMAVSAANAKIASTEYAKSVADAAEAAAISAAAEDATTKADAAKTAAINAAATDAQTKATAALGSANEYTDSKITKLTTTGAIKTNTDAISANTTAIGEINNGTVMKSGITAEGVAQIETNKTDIATLKGTGEGSVSKAITDNIAELTATVTGDAGVIKTLSQTAGKVSATRELVTTTELDETVNTALTNANAAAAFMTSVQGASTNQTDAKKAYVLTASKDDQGNMTYTWEEIDRSVLN